MLHLGFNYLQLLHVCSIKEHLCSVLSVLANSGVAKLSDADKSKILKIVDGSMARDRAREDRSAGFGFWGR